MKIDSLIVLYLYKNRKVSIQQIGHFEIDSSIPDPIPDQIKSLPEGSIHFIYDEKATADQGFLNFIIEQTKKIRPLATSDLESFSTLNRQFLNIGKPLVIQNLGTLNKTQNNEIAFTQGLSTPPKPETPKQVPGTKEQSPEPVNFSEKKKRNRKTGWIIPSILLLIVAGILIILFFKINIIDIFKNKQEAIPVTEAEATPPAISNDTLASTHISDSCYFNLILANQLDSMTAVKKMKRFKIHTDSTIMMIKYDSSHFNIVYPLTILKKDSTRISDSILNRVNTP